MNNEPAFPVADYDHQVFEAKTVEETKRYLSGMSLRDYFAAKAITGVLAESIADKLYCESIASRAYYLADQMMKAREMKE